MPHSPSRSVVICGGGVIGLSCAHYLGRSGFQVTVLERSAEYADSCAQGSAGYISPSHVIPLSAPGMVIQGMKWMLNSRSPFYIKPRLDPELFRWGWLFAKSCTTRHTKRAAPVLRDLCLGGRKLWMEWADLTGNVFEMRTEGLVNLCKTQQGLDHEAHSLAELARSLGIEARVLDRAQTSALEPGVKMEVAGSVYFPIDAHVTPQKFMPAFSDLLKKMGVLFRWNTEVLSWSKAGDRITGAETTVGPITADEYVLAGGSWSPKTAAVLGLRLPMQPGKGYSLTLKQPRLRPAKSLMLTERRVAVTPMGDQLRFGGTMELSGHNRKIRSERVAQIIAAAQDYLPEFTEADFSGITPWFGFRPVSPDGLPYLGRFRRYSNLTSASGHAMLGLTMAPISGLLVAEILTGQKPSVDLALLSPDRYG